MDAKIGDWVVTPRHGKPVEINGLWANALRVMERLAERLDSPHREEFRTAGDRAATAFEAKFWHEGRGFYLDTADPDDASLRPNQVIAMALPFTPCDPEHARRALQVVGRELATPYGLRTLGPEESGYRGRYEGPMNERDASYHQGTAWPWLLGPYATAVARFGEGTGEARRLLREAKTMLTEYGLGGVAEVYDGDSPQRPGGCPWQAWSVGELLRAWVEDARGE
jgi:predicted glycogen debranching enzyme